MRLYKRISRKGLCARDLNKQIALYERKLIASTPDSMASGNVEMEKIGDFMAGLETSGNVEKVMGLNAGDGISHVFYVKYSSRIVDREGQSTYTYVKFRDKYYRVLYVENMNENNKVLVVVASYRGDPEKKESEA